MFTRATLNSRFKRPNNANSLPDFLSPLSSVKSVRRRRQQYYLNHLVNFIPDRLASAKWLNRCQIEGLEHIRQAQKNNRPIILGFCHFGPYYLLHFWLRAAGLPTTMLVSGKSQHRRRWQRWTDRYVLCPEIPPVIHQDQLRMLGDCLAAGHPVGIAIDTRQGKQITVPLCPGWDFQMPTGAIRLAIRHQAELIPCTILDEGGWRFRIHFDAPVPREHLTAEADWTDAGKYLLTVMQPHFRARPDQFSALMLHSLRPNPPNAKRQP